MASSSTILTKPALHLLEINAIMVVIIKTWEVGISELFLEEEGGHGIMEVVTEEGGTMELSEEVDGIMEVVNDF